jgi:hypothetical protein
MPNINSPVLATQLSQTPANGPVPAIIPALMGPDRTTSQVSVPESTPFAQLETFVQQLSASPAKVGEKAALDILNNPATVNNLPPVVPVISGLVGAAMTPDLLNQLGLVPAY